MQNQASGTPIQLVERPFSENPFSQESAMKETEVKNIGKIDEELRKLWDGLGGGSRVRACLFNLIIYTREDCRTQYFSELQEAICKRFPSRIIFIHCESNAKEDLLTTKVSVMSSGEVNNSITCDKIRINASASQLFRVPFLVLPLIMPDLPVYLMWGQDPQTDNTILPHLERFATRVLVDSDCSSDLLGFAQRMRSRCDQGGCEIMDFNWARLGGWRRLFARIFDTPQKINKLKKTVRFKITYNCLESSCVQHPSVQALYLQAWLAAQLEWNYLSIKSQPGLHVIAYSSDSYQVKVELEAKAVKEAPPGSILDLSIATALDDHIRIEREGGSRHVKVSVSSPESCELPAHYLLSHLTRQQSLLREIFYESPGSHYERMLAALEKLHFDGSP